MSGAVANAPRGRAIVLVNYRHLWSVIVRDDKWVVSQLDSQLVVFYCVLKDFFRDKTILMQVFEKMEVRADLPLGSPFDEMLHNMRSSLEEASHFVVVLRRKAHEGIPIAEPTHGSLRKMQPRLISQVDIDDMQRKVDGVMRTEAFFTFMVREEFAWNQRPWRRCDGFGGGPVADAFVIEHRMLLREIAYIAGLAHGHIGDTAVKKRRSRDLAMQALFVPGFTDKRYLTAASSLESFGSVNLVLAQEVSDALKCRLIALLWHDDRPSLFTGRAVQPFVEVAVTETAMQTPENDS
jgi:hypothetical protein